MLKSEFDNIDNPFADPSIIEAVSEPQHFSSGDYDPFKIQEANLPKTSIDNCEAAIISLTNEQIPQSSQLTMEALLKRQQELDKLQEELYKKEEELKRSGFTIRANNWPPLPKNCIFQPCFYQNIEVDIPFEFQSIVTNLYHLWIFQVALLFLNIIGGIFLKSAVIIVEGMVYLVLFTPMSYICWFRTAYKAFSKDSSFSFVTFFFVFSVQIFTSAIQALGIPGSGVLGFFSALSSFSTASTGSFLVGLFSIFIAFGFIINVIAELVLIQRIHTVYRNSGASFKKAQAEFTTEFLNGQISS